MKFTVGGLVRRVEDRRLLVGHGVYTDDIRLLGMVHGFVLRSPHAHARILRIDKSEAAALPGVLAVLTANDYLGDGCRPIPYPLPEPRNAQNLRAHLPSRLPLTGDNVRFVGDPVAFVVADTPDAARAAAELVGVEYEPMPSITETAAATNANAPAVWEKRPGNVCFLHEGGNPNAVDDAFARAHKVVRGKFSISRVAINPMETRGCVAAYDPRQGICTVHAGVQDVFSARTVLAGVFGIPESMVNVLSPDVGGSFGLKGVDPELILTVWAARATGRPVKWIADRSEAFAGDNHGRDNATEAELAVDQNGIFLGLRVRTIAAVGAYPSIFAAAPPVNNLGSLAGVYRTPAIDVRVIGAFTNTAPTGPYRGAGRPEASYVIERMVDLAARELGLDRAEIRRRNMIPPQAMPFRTGLTYTYDCGEFEKVMDRALSIAGYSAFEARRAESKELGKLRGLGIATVVERAGFVETLESVEVRFSPTGEALVVAGSTDQGQGHKTMYAQILCERLGMDADKVRVVEANTALLETGGMTGSSRVSAMGSGALLLALDKVVAKGRMIAAHALEAAESDIAFEAGRCVVSGTDRAIALGEIAARAFQPRLLPPGLEPGLGETGTFRAVQESFPNSCHACEIEIDPETGDTALLRYVVVDDVGTVINPLVVKGQVHGGVAQGAGQALLETVAYDPGTGQLLTGSFMDYCMPRADDLCHIEVETHAVPTRGNPLGAKGAGEAGTVGALPAVINAVLDALSPLGIRHIDMPATSEAVWRAIRSRALGNG